MVKLHGRSVKHPACSCSCAINQCQRGQQLVLPTRCRSLQRNKSHGAESNCRISEPRFDWDGPPASSFHLSNSVIQKTAPMSGLGHFRLGHFGQGDTCSSKPKFKKTTPDNKHQVVDVPNPTPERKKNRRTPKQRPEAGLLARSRPTDLNHAAAHWSWRARSSRAGP